MNARSRMQSLVARGREAVEYARGEGKERVVRLTPVRLGLGIAKQISQDDATHLAAGVAYYAILGIFPLLLGIIALLGVFLDDTQVQDQLFELVDTYVPGTRGLVEQNIEQVVRARGALGVVSAVGLLWTASALFGAVSRAVNRAWGIQKDRPFYIAKPRHILMALCVGVLFFLSFAGATAIRFLADLPVIGDAPLLTRFTVTVGGYLVTFLLTFLIFLGIYKFIPNTRTYWRQVIPGALVGAALFEIAKAVFLLYLQMFANYEAVYGQLGNVIILLVWSYFSAFIVILGAEFSTVWWQMRQEREDERAVEPVLQEPGPPAP